MKMRRLVSSLSGSVTAGPVAVAISVVLAALSSSPVAAQSPTCGTAVLLDIEVVTARIPQPTITSVHARRRGLGGSDERAMDVYSSPAERQTKTYLVTVRLDDLVYTAQSAGNDFWHYDPTRLVINDPIEACVSGDRLRLRRPDGKDYSPKIVRAVRDGVQH